MGTGATSYLAPGQISLTPLFLSQAQGNWCLHRNYPTLLTVGGLPRKVWKTAFQGKWILLSKL